MTQADLFVETAPEALGSAFEPVRPVTDAQRLNAAQERVLAFLKAHVGEWVDTWTLITEAHGGSRAAARTWELIQKGHPIEKRHHSKGRWQWRYSDASSVDIPTVGRNAIPPIG